MCDKGLLRQVSGSDMWGVGTLLESNDPNARFGVSSGIAEEFLLETCIAVCSAKIWRLRFPFCWQKNDLDFCLLDRSLSISR